MKKNALLYKMKNSYVGYIMIAPLFVGLIMFAYYPPIYGLILSLFEKSGQQIIFCGLDNYARLFKDEIFLNSIPTMFQIALPKIIISVVIPLICAEIIFGIRSEKKQGIYRMLLLIPMIVPGVVGTLIWKAIYDPANGVMTNVVRALGVISSDTNINWLGDSKYVIFSIIFMGFPWIGGTNVLIYLAGLNYLSGEIIESTKLDGASTYKRIILIDLPLLLGQIRYFLVFGLIGNLQDYSVQVLLTNGGPGYDTYVPGYYMYHQAFMFNNKYYASTIGCFLFVVILVITLLVNKFTNKDLSEV